MAVKDYSADKRQEYNQMISAKEHELTELKTKENALLEAIGTFDTTTKSSFSQLFESNQNLVALGSRVAQSAMDEDQEIAQSMSSFVIKQQEEIPQVFAKARKAAEDEIEALQRKRDALPWDKPKKDTKEK